MEMEMDYTEPAQQILTPSLNDTLSYPQMHILSGSFRSLSLFLLVFHPVRRTLRLVQRIPGFGPHQYVETNKGDKSKATRAYTTSWAVPPILSSWEIQHGEEGRNAEWSVRHIQSVNITAVSSYISLPPPYTHIYSAGGPTGEVHAVSGPSTTETTNTTYPYSFGAKTQELLFVPPSELENADKTRKALRYGSHAVEFARAPVGTSLDTVGLAFIPVLGTNSIEVYAHSPSSGILTHLSSTTSPRAHDGPRHLKIHPNGKMLYVVTEHTNLVDAWRVEWDAVTSEGLLREERDGENMETSTSTSGELSDSGKKSILTRIATHSLLPPYLANAGEDVVRKWRGDTLMVGPAGQDVNEDSTHREHPTELWVTTRGATESERGWVSVIRLDGEGMFASPPALGTSTSSIEEGVERYETPTSGGKAHAIDLYPKDPVLFTSDANRTRAGSSSSGSPTWILLTDDSDLAAGESSTGTKKWTGGGGVRILEWDGWGTGGVREVAGWPPREAEENEHGFVDNGEKEGEIMRGGSHAVWLD